LSDLSGREKTALFPAALAALVMGVAPLIWLNSIETTVQTSLAPFAQLAARMVIR
jgi:hypothetical protein